jgi:H+-transporting ATPase
MIRAHTTEEENKADTDKLPNRLSVNGNGLSSEEAKERLQQYGYNELPEEKVNPVLKFLSYFWGPIPWMIEVAAVLSALVHHWEDLGIILALLVMNGIVGFWEEYQAGNTIAALKAKLALKARVKRDGAWTAIPARELVPGDMIRLRIGEIVPADARLLEGDPVEVDQSTLTGESLPVTRKTGDAVYSGSIIRQGEIDGLVDATGKNTYFGKTAQLVETAHTISHFQRAVLKIGDFLILIAIALVVLIIVVALFRHDNMVTTIQFALVLTVASIPVAMPTVLSVTMAVGARLLAQKQAIVSRLVSVEEMAGIDVLCSDKTGTLTQNRLTIGDPYCLNGTSPGQVILSAALASRAEDQDPIDMAILSGLKDEKELAAYEVVHFQPFDPVHKRTEATVKDIKGYTFKVNKGAPQVILELAANADDIRDQVDDAVNKFAIRGFRSLGVARTDEQGQWQFLGVIPLYDPPRGDSKTTIEAAEKMGVNVKMVTGDQIAIAKEIARQLGLGQNILDAGLFSETKHHESAQLRSSIEQVDGFAQVFPEHKYHIVDVLQQQGHIVGMTGDGVNDAPALKKADAGIAVSGATDAARIAASIVLLTPGLSVIIDAIKESRKIFQRMNSYAIYRIAETIRVLLFMALSILVFNFYPVTAVMIVLLALLNDGPILAIAYDRTHYSDQPEAWNMPAVLGVATVLGIAGVFSSFGLFYLAEHTFHLSRDVIQTFIFLKLAVAGHLTIFITRARGPFWSIRPAPLLLWTAVGTKLLPISWKWAVLIWGYALIWFLLNDRVKLVSYRIFSPEQPGLLVRRSKGWSS